MLISVSSVYSAVEKYQRSRPSKETSSKDHGATVADGASVAFRTFTLLVSMLFFFLELILLFYAVGIAITCSKPGAERIVNLVLAITFTIPYMLVNTVFNNCAKQRLRAGLFTPNVPSVGDIASGSDLRSPQP